MGESQFLEKPEARTVRMWEFLVYARQLSQERQTQDLQDPQNERVRKALTTKEFAGAHFRE
jgi:hypothetical protein